jgi:hypothetical protein
MSQESAEDQQPSLHGFSVEYRVEGPRVYGKFGRQRIGCD